MPVRAVPHARAAASPPGPSAARRRATPGRPTRGRLHQRPHLPRDDVHHVALPLQVPVHEQQRVTPHDRPQPLPGVRPERDVDHPGLVLEGEEHRPARRHRVLARDHQAAEAHPPRPPLRQRRVRHRAQPVQRVPEQRHRLAPRVQPHHGVGVAQSLRLGERRQGRRLRRGQAQVHRPAGGARDPLRPPRPARPRAPSTPRPPRAAATAAPAAAGPASPAPPPGSAAPRPPRPGRSAPPRPPGPRTARGRAPRPGAPAAPRRSP